MSPSSRANRSEPNVDALHTFRLGDFEITIISEGNVYGDPAIVFEGTDESVWRPLTTLDEQGRIVFGLNIILIRTNDRLILLDTGIGEPSEAREHFETMFPFSPHLPLLYAFDRLEISPNAVTDVVYSHVHADHIMGTTVERDGERVPAYPNARHYMHRADGGHIPERPDRKANYNLHIPVLREHGLFTLIEDRHEIAPGMTTIHAPGESPGHILVRLESRGEILYYVGDLFHDPCEAEHIDFVWPGRDREAMIPSREDLIDRAVRENALLIAAHTPFPGIARIGRSSDGIDWQVIDKP